MTTRILASAAAAGAVLVVGWWVTGLTPFTVGASAAVVGAGLLAMVAGRLLAGERSTANAPNPGLAPWLILGGAAGAWQIAAYLQHPRADHPTLSVLANAMLHPRPVRTIAFAAWMFGAGWLGSRR